MKIAILKTDTVRPQWSGTYGEYPDMFIELLSNIDSGLLFEVYDVQQDHYPSSIDAADAFLVTGSRAGVYEDHPWIPALVSYIQQLHHHKRKLIGICFGHQVIAHALGGKVQKATAGWGIGRHRYQLSSSAKGFDLDSDEFHLLASHQDQVLVPPDDSDVLASSEFCPVAALKIQNHGLTFQGHPEFVPGYARELMHYRRDMYDEEHLQKALASLSLPTDHVRVGQWIIDFLRA